MWPEQHIPLLPSAALIARVRLPLAELAHAWHTKDEWFPTAFPTFLSHEAHYLKHGLSDLTPASLKLPSHQLGNGSPIYQHVFMTPAVKKSGVGDGTTRISTY